MDDEVRALYDRLLTAWNERDARQFAAQFLEDGHMVGFDGSQADSASEIAEHLSAVFASHPTAPYVWKVRGVLALTDSVALLRAVTGMVPPGQTELNPAVNAIQSLVAVRRGGTWRIAMLQTTPAAFHGRPEAVESLTDELRALLAPASR